MFLLPNRNFCGFIRLTWPPTDDPESLFVKEGDSIHAIYRGFIRTAEIESGINSVISPILVSTDKADYSAGEIIEISGSVAEGNPKHNVYLSIIDPHGETIYSEEIDLSYVLRFGTEINTENSKWKFSGNYKILVWHETEKQFAETVFSYSSTYREKENQDVIKIFNSQIYLDHTITSGKITLVKSNLSQKSLIFSINSNSGGHLSVDLPRQIIDSRDSTGDISFVVLMDDRITEFVEKANPTSRTLTIPYHHNTRTLEIQGTVLELNPQIQEKSVVIPEWVKNNAEWWSKDLIGEQDFVAGLEFLIFQGIIEVPLVQSDENKNTETTIPVWIKNTSRWWSEGSVSDDEFVNAIQFMINSGLISV